MISWKELAIEYRKEIDDLWNDIEDALFEFDKKSPKSFSIGLNILERSLDLSKKNVRMLSRLETINLALASDMSSNISKKSLDKKENALVKDEDDFDWLFEGT